MSLPQDADRKKFRPYDPDAPLPMPVRLRDWLPEKHWVYVASDVVDTQDLSGIHAHYEKTLRGQPPYDPRLMVKLGHVSFDGTKVKANASKHKAMSYARMLAKEAELEEEVDELLRQAQEEDDAEDTRYGKARRGDEIPEELRFKQKRLQTIREAKERLERRVREKAIEEGKLNPEGTPKPTSGRPPKTPHGQPKPKDQENFTDPESRIVVKGDKAFVQGWNAQAAVDGEHQIIVGRHVTNEANDKRQVKPLTEHVKANTGQAPAKASADNG